MRVNRKLPAFADANGGDRRALFGRMCIDRPNVNGTLK